MKPPIYIFDPQEDGKRRVWQSLREDNITPLPVDLVPVEQVDLYVKVGENKARPVCEKDVFVCLVHYTRLPSEDVQMNRWADHYKEARFIALSGALYEPPDTLPPNVFYYTRPIISEEIKTDAFRAKFLRWYQSWVTKHDIGWDAFDSDTEFQDALRILCAALDFARKSDSKETYFKLNRKAIENPVNWLRPFGLDTATGIEYASVLKKIADEIGDAKFKKALKIFVLAKKDNSEEFKKEIQGLVDDYLGRHDSPAVSAKVISNQLMVENGRNMA